MKWQIIDTFSDKNENLHRQTILFELDIFIIL